MQSNHGFGKTARLTKAWFQYGRKNRVTIFLKGQFTIVYTGAGCSKVG
jgi:hypothetical protein